MNAEEFLASTAGDTTVTHADLIQIGNAVLNLATAVPLMRHAGPVGTLDYAEPDDIGGLIVRDLLRWSVEPEARGRLTRYLERTGWSRNAVSAS